MTTDDLIEALVKLCDEFSELHRVSGPNAVDLVQDLTGLYHLNEIGSLYVQGGLPVQPDRYRQLLDQAETMIKRHFGVTELNNDILEGELLERMYEMAENANE
jgi:hypothetical protein